MESHIRYIKVVGGPIDHEILLVGLKNGQVSCKFLYTYAQWDILVILCKWSFLMGILVSVCSVRVYFNKSWYSDCHCHRYYFCCRFSVYLLTTHFQVCCYSNRMPSGVLTSVPSKMPPILFHHLLLMIFISNSKLAVVDENYSLLVYDIRTKELLFQVFINTFELPNKSCCLVVSP